MHYPLEHHSASIVLIGHFNPAIFSPGWLAKIDIISEEARQNAVLDVILPDIAKFRIDRFALEVLANRFSISTQLEPFERILDDVFKIFTEHLAETPLFHLGINYEAIFKLKSFQQRDSFGRQLAPIEPWRALGQRFKTEDLSLTGGLAALAMKEFPRTDRQRGYRQVAIEPWNVPGLLPKLQTSVKMGINDHYEVEQQAANGAGPIMGILEDAFEPSIAMSQAVVSDIMECARGYE